jgi:Entner-Doudoroff aldolase
MVSEITKKIEALGVFPIIVLNQIDHVGPLAEAFLEAELPCAEVTFRTAVAEKALSKFKREFPEILLGAGTILELDQAKAAFDAGAEFILTPGFNPRIVDYCLNLGIKIYPGVCTPSEMEIALSKGLRELKFFPAEAIGGLSYLKAVSGPLSMLRFIPTGGVNPDNLAAYLRFKPIIACAGSWISPVKRIQQQQFDQIREEASRAVQIARQIRGGNEWQKRS